MSRSRTAGETSAPGRVLKVVPRVSASPSPLLLLALASATLAATLALATLARAQSPTPGGTVPSTLELSLGEPSPFRRVATTRGGLKVFAATLRAEVTATDVPTRLSLGFEGPPLRRWREPLGAESAKLQLRELAPNRNALRNRTVVVTLTAGGP